MPIVGSNAIHSSHQRALRDVGRVLLVLASVQLVTWLLPVSPVFNAIPYYLPLHTLLEFISIYVSMMVFAVGWGLHGRTTAGNVTLLASVFFFVGLLDFSHTMSYGGMPDFLSHNDAQKHLYFWLSARLLAAAALLGIALRPWRPLARPNLRYGAFALLAVLIALLHWLVLAHEPWLPDTFVPDRGLTPFKKEVEYVVIALNLATAAVLWTRLRTPQAYKVVLLFGATCTLALSELYFTLYTTMTGGYNVLGHVYKVLAYLFIYRAIVVEVIEEPYRNLAILTQEQNAILASRIVGIVKIKERRFSWANDAFAAALGYDKQEIIDLPTRAVYASDTAFAAFAEAAYPVIRAGGVFRGEVQLRRKDARLGWFDVTGSAGGLDAGESIWAMVDITQRRQALAALHEKEFLLTEAQRIGRLGSWHYSLAGELHWSEETYRIFRVDPSRFTPSFAALLDLLHPDDRPAMQAWIRDCASGKRPGELEFRIRTPDGTERVLNGSGELQYDAEGLALQITGVVQDITERKRLEGQIRELAFLDPLTRLPNRRMLDDRLALAMAASKRSGRYGALIFVDLDNFKPLNDRHGHDLGDQLLVEVARRIRACVREIDTVARFGGDEFQVLLGELQESRSASESDARGVAEKIRNTLAQTYELTPSAQSSAREVVLHHCTASIGVLLFLGHNQRKEDLYRQVDMAMYQAKRAGRNTLRLVESDG